MAAVGAVVSFLLLSIPFGFFGLAFLAGGAVAVFLYQRRSPGAPLTSGLGAKVGAASGAFSFVIVAIQSVAAYVYHSDELRKLLDDALAQNQARFTILGYDADQVRTLFDFLKTPEGLAFYVAFGLAFLLVIFLAGGALGGAITARFSGQRSSGKGGTGSSG
jgi:hypothetical protein